MAEDFPELKCKFNPERYIRSETKYQEKRALTQNYHTTETAHFQQIQKLRAWGGNPFQKIEKALGVFPERGDEWLDIISVP